MGVAQPAQQLAAHLPVGPVPALPAPRRPVVGRSAGEVPRAEVSDRALVAAGSPGHTDEGPELHDGDVPRVRRLPSAGIESAASWASARLSVRFGKALPSRCERGRAGRSCRRRPPGCRRRSTRRPPPCRPRRRAARAAPGACRHLPAVDEPWRWGRRRRSPRPRRVRGAATAAAGAGSAAPPRGRALTRPQQPAFRAEAGPCWTSSERPPQTALGRLRGAAACTCVHVAATGVGRRGRVRINVKTYAATATR